MDTSISQLTMNSDLTIDKLKTQLLSQGKSKGDKVVFEKVINELLVKELLAPVIKNGFAGMGSEYGYLLQNSLTDFLSENMNFIYDSQGVEEKI